MCSAVVLFLALYIVHVTGTGGCSPTDFEVRSDPTDPSNAVAEWKSSHDRDPRTRFTLWFDSKKGGKSLSVIADKPKGAQYKIVVPAVSPNTIYSFKVQCVNGTGWGTSGKTKYYMTPVEYVPPVPVDMRVTDMPNDFTQMRISWNISEQLEGTFAGYRLNLQDEKLASKDILIAPNETSTLVGNLSPLTKYFAQLFLSNKFGKTSRSLPFSFVSQDVPRPSQARNVKVLKDETDLSRAFITWDPPLKPNGHVWYLVFYDLANVDTDCSNISKVRHSARLTPAPRVPGTDPARPAIVTDLQPDTIFLFHVQVINSNGFDSISNPVYYRTPKDFTPSKPRSLEATPTEQKGSYLLTWISPDIQNGIITGYEVSWEDSNKSLVSKAVIDVQATLSLTSNQTYFVTVVAKNSHNFTSKAASVTIQTPPEESAVFKNMSVETVSPTSLKLQWNAEQAKAYMVVYASAATWLSSPPSESVSYETVHCPALDYSQLSNYARYGSQRVQVKLDVSQLTCRMVASPSPDHAITITSLKQDTIYVFRILQIHIPRPNYNYPYGNHWQSELLHPSEVLYGKTSHYSINPPKDVKVAVTVNPYNRQYQAKVTWTKPSPVYTSMYYVVEYQSAQGGHKVTQRVQHGSTLTLTGLTRGTSYFLHVATHHPSAPRPAYSDNVLFNVTTQT